MIEKNTIVKKNTVYGSIYVKLSLKEAPTNCNNFLRYINEHRYKDFHFYRTVTMSNQRINNIKIEVMQGGFGFEKHPQKLPPILHETTNSTPWHELKQEIRAQRFLFASMINQI